MVGNSDSGTWSNDTETWYRGWKDFLIWVDVQNPANSIEIEKKDDDPAALSASLYECTNVTDDPGTFREGGSAGGPGGARILPLSLNRSQGLYRLRIMPANNHMLFTVAINNVQWYAMECWEPRYNFYVFGRTNPDPPAEPLPRINQYFFIPRLPAGETVRIRLQTEKQSEQAMMTIYRGESEEIASFATKGKSATSSEKPYFNTLELSGSDLPASDPGEVYRFELSNPSRSVEQPGGNTWVRFSRNVPPYFANEANRLIYPIVHRSFEPVLYAGETETYRSFLTVHRDNTDIIPANSRLVMAVNTTTGSSATGDYTYSVSVTAPAEQLKVSGSRALAQLQYGSALIADSTDKVDTVYFVKKPSFGTSWPTKILLAYDNGNGGASSVLKGAHFNTVQTDTSTTLDTIDGAGLKAMGALYAGSIKDWFDAGNADSSKVRFWAILDEPDSGPGESGPVKSLKTDIYDTYYDLKAATTTDKPFSLNIMHPIFIEEFSRGSDIISSDPFVLSTSDNNINRIRDCAQELYYNASGVNAAKKTLIILWWWNPNADDPASTANTATLYGDSFDLIDDVVVGIGGWNFSGGGNRLDTSTDEQVRALWTQIKAKNDPERPQ